MGSEYINQKVMEGLEGLIVQFSPENLCRLKMAILTSMQGVLPINRGFLGQATVRYLDQLELHINGQAADDFDVLKEHYIGYIMSSQRDEGLRCAHPK